MIKYDRNIICWILKYDNDQKKKSIMSQLKQHVTSSQ